MSRSKLSSMMGVMALLLTMAWLTPGEASARDRQAGDAAERPRATEALNPVHRRAAEVRVIRHDETGRRAYAYEVRGRERVSVAAPRRVEHQPMRVQRHNRRVDDVERDTARRVVSNYRQSEVLETRNSAEVLQAPLSHEVQVVPAVHRPSARERAEAAVHRASRRHAQSRADHRRDHHRAARHDRRREVYAGYHHTPRSRVTGSLRFHSQPTYVYRSHRHRSHYWLDAPVTVRHYYHFNSRHRHRFGTSVGVHLGSRHGVCAPLRFHHHRFHRFGRHHHRGGNLSIQFNF